MSELVSGTPTRLPRWGPRPVPPHVHAALARAEEGRGVSREEALSLMEAAEPASLFQAAASVRDRRKGRTVSYSKKVFIPLTQLLRDFFHYFTFSGTQRLDGSAYLSPDAVLSRGWP